VGSKHGIAHIIGTLI